ncbi:MAG: hypothetical protein PVI86_16915, partial [Phycisphaerae bacterium]
AVGCSGPRRSDYTSSQTIAMADRSDDADRLWTAIQDTLRDNPYHLDRVDRRTGVITTLPEPSQQFFEFWRHDVDTGSDLWESTLNPIRRWVEVRVVRGEDGQWSEIDVAVHKERLSSPDRQFNSTGAAYQYFGDRLPSTTGLERVTAEDDTWLEVGRDPAMEEYLLTEILKRAGIQAAFMDAWDRD